jgi:membrane-bound lytic murein transglycosylase A
MARRARKIGVALALVLAAIGMGVSVSIWLKRQPPPQVEVIAPHPVAQDTPVEPPVHGAPREASPPGIEHLMPPPPEPAPFVPMPRRAVTIPDPPPITSPVMPVTGPDIQLLPVTFAELEGWASDDHASAWDAFHASCVAIDRRILPSRAALPVGEALQRICREALQIGANIDAPSARRFFETRFQPLRISRIGDSTGLITGYYEPIVDGSREPTDRFSVPLRRRPPDLTEGPANREGGRPVFGRLENGRIVPYFSRAEIENGALARKDTEIVWLKDPVDAFFIHIQGSTRVRLPSGEMVRLNYDAQNGHPYVAIGRELIERGLVRREEMSLDAIRAWIGANPVEGRELMRRNPSYIFFRETALADHEEAMGAQGIPLKAWRSIAVDRNLHVYGTPFWIEAELPIESAAPTTRFRQLMIAQDTGGAILGPARADIYVGAGDVAGRIAGRFRHPGRFVILVPAGADPVRGADAAPSPAPRGKGKASNSGT